MVFSSITFLLYFLPIVIAGNFLLGFSRRLQNIWLLIASIFFYAWGEPVFVFVLILSIIINWIAGLLIDKYDDNQYKRKVVLVVDIILNVLLFAVFKYTNFIVDNINIVLGDFYQIKVPQIALPIGISFFTFQIISYIIDLYRREVVVQKNLLDLALYVAFFPQLVAGPIVRYNSIADQIKNRKHTFDKFTEGVNRFCQGLIKKIVLANNLAIVADQIFNLSLGGTKVVRVPIMLAWLAAIAYTLQIYYDFSSYSDMAIGLGKIFGFEFEENFNYPMIAKSAREFMARWHISLQTWFTQYVYIPLGGSRVENKDKAIRNMFIVWLLTGVWHGAAWNYIFWGMFFFIFITIEKLIMFEKWRDVDWLKRIYVFFMINTSMVIFRSESMYQLSEMLKNMYGLNGSGFYSSTAVMMFKEYFIIFVVSIICSIPLKQIFAKKFDRIPGVVKGIGGVFYVTGMSFLMFFCITVLAKGGYNPFIYFNF